jgi:pimeloyl-ACP methyl ester carboxylesterase
LRTNSTNVRRTLGLAWWRLNIGLKAAFAPAKAVDTAARLFTTPPRFAHTARELEFLATGTRFQVAGPFGAIAAWRFGREEQPVVLLSHGWGGRGAQLRAFVPALIAAGYQPVTFDHPCHGFSESAESTLVHFEQGLDAVARHLEAGGARIAGVIGHSLGAAAAGAWLNRTGRELRAVLVASPTSLQRYSSYFARKLGIGERLRSAMQERFERRLGRPWKDFELPQSVANVRTPALVIHDTADGDVAFASGLALARAWPQARFVATSGLGHRAILRDPAVVRDAIDFIADQVVFAPAPARGEPTAFATPAPVF